MGGGRPMEQPLERRRGGRKGTLAPERNQKSQGRTQVSKQVSGNLKKWAGEPVLYGFSPIAFMNAS